MTACRDCGKEGPLASRRPVCKECHNKYTRQHYLDNKQKYIDRVAKYNKKQKDKVRELKNVPCMDCNTVYPYYVMDFDHREDKKFNISQSMDRYGWAKILEEVAKCDVVCSNCHRIRTYNRMAP